MTASATQIGTICNLLVLIACLVSAGNAMIRYAFSYSSNGWLEAQWYMFAILVMFGASYTFKRNEHVRVEILYLMLSERGQLWLDLIGTLFFLIPACLLLAYLSWPFFYQAYAVGEMSGNAGGLHHRATVDLPELLGVQLRQQFLERGADQVLALGRQHAQVLVGRFQHQHLVEGHQVQRVAHAGLDRLQAVAG